LSFCVRFINPPFLLLRWDCVTKTTVTFYVTKERQSSVTFSVTVLLCVCVERFWCPDRPRRPARNRTAAHRERAEAPPLTHTHTQDKHTKAKGHTARFRWNHTQSGRHDNTTLTHEQRTGKGEEKSRSAGPAARQPWTEGAQRHAADTHRREDHGVCADAYTATAPSRTERILERPRS